MKKKILFVDDDKSVLKSLQRLLVDENVNVFTASDAQSALDIIRDNVVVAVFSDYFMPGMDGLGFLATVKNTYPDTVRILMTGHADVQLAIKAVNEGDIFKFILKPWDEDGLIQSVREAVHRYEVTDSLKQAEGPSLLSLSQTIELKDQYTQGHCNRVAAYSLIIAEALKLSAETLNYIRYGAWLHDCGKIGVKESILNSSRKLEEEEWDIIKLHPVWGADVAVTAELHPVVVNIIHYHHEKYDGTGYPAGLRGAEIPLEARIVAIADVFDAITTDRSYRGKRSVEYAFDLLVLERGKHFDPVMIDIFIDNVELVRKICEVVDGNLKIKVQHLQ